MSLSAKRFPTAIRFKQTLEESLFEEGYRYVAGKLEDIFLKPEHISQENLVNIKQQAEQTTSVRYARFSTTETDKFEHWLEAQSYNRVAKYCARSAWYQGKDDLNQLLSDWAAKKAIQKWMDEQNPEILKFMDLDNPWKLMHLGIRYTWQAHRFCDFYIEVCRQNRPWGSCFQPRHENVRAIALTPNYNRLPLWVKKVMVSVKAPIFSSERIGNVWRLVDCAKAWKHCPELPKNIAEKVGKLSPKMRILGAIAWSNCSEKYWHKDNYSRWRKFVDREPVDVSRQEVNNFFWEELQRLSKYSLAHLIEEAKDSYKLRILAENILNLPHNFLKNEWGNDRQCQLKAIAKYGNPVDVCQQLFGVAGKRTVQLFKSCRQVNWRWASTLAHGNADAVQKILGMDKIIDFQEEPVEFLLSLPLNSRIRLLQTTDFRYRGVVHPVTNDYIRDTGYLWTNIKEKPVLGRIRCWFSIHEQLSAAYVKELPDEALPINSKWQPIDGLCAVDGSWEIEIPKRVATLKYYGQILHNCVGGYGEAIKSGRSIIFVVRERGQLTHCVEVCGSSVQQFYRANNSSPDWSIENSIKKVLRQAGLID